MKEKRDNKQLSDKQSDGKMINDLPGYPSNPEGEDIFDKFQEEQDLNPEDISETKSENAQVKSGGNNNMNEKEDASGNELDVPGLELDDEPEEIGSGDEENNYYRIGGGDHNELDENKS